MILMIISIKCSAYSLELLGDIKSMGEKERFIPWIFNVFAYKRKHTKNRFKMTVFREKLPRQIKRETV